MTDETPDAATEESPDRPAAETPVEAPEETPAGTPGEPPEVPAAEVSDGRWRGWRSQALVGGLCLLLGFAIVVQVRQTQGDELAGLRQDDLVRLLDEITQRNEELQQEAGDLRDDRAALLSGSDASRSAEDYLELQRILAGTVPVEGPGVVVTVEGTGRLTAQTMVHMLEELRNAGAEAIELSGVRLVASSYFVDAADGSLVVDGVTLEDPQQWRVIGDSATLIGALDIPGGALSSLRNAGADVEVTERDLVQITTIRTVADPQYASPPSDEG